MPALLGALILLAGMVAIAAGIIVSVVAAPAIGDPAARRSGIRNLALAALLIAGGFAVYLFGVCLLASRMFA